jgi:hypothetical protein
MSIVARYSTVQLQVRAARSIYCAALTEKNKWRAGTTRRRGIFQTDLDLDLSQDESVTARHAGIQRGQYRAGLSLARLHEPQAILVIPYLVIWRSYRITVLYYLCRLCKFKLPCHLAALPTPSQAAAKTPARGRATRACHRIKG